MEATEELALGTKFRARSNGYLVFLVIFMGLVAVMDQYISTVKSTALPYIIEEYGITASQFSWNEAVYLIATFFIFLLNGLNDIIGRRLSILVLALMMGLSSIAIVLFTPTFQSFMIFYTIAMFTTVSNMWTIPISEESPAEKRAKYVSLVYVIGLIPLQALLPPLLLNVLKLDWRWMYGAMFVLMLPLLVMWQHMKETGRYNLIRRQRNEGTLKRHLFGVGVINRRDLRYIAISSSIWLAWLVYSVLYYWAGYYFMTVKGYTLSQWSLVLLGTLLMAMTGGVAAGRIMDRVGRNTALVAGCVILALLTVGIALADGILLPIVTAVSGFFTSFTYTWIVVYVPEVFPTERRGACMGWTTTVARVSYVLGPALAAVLLRVSPTMEWFWVAAGAIILIPIAIILGVKPYETKIKELELIAVER
ncbi:MAG: MFS transporter [Anaerolineae bacterium]|nr:MFS transporter [Anaerolineae bacterium]